MTNTTTICDWSISVDTWDGSSYSYFNDVPSVKANPDISGIGVLTGFIATGYLTLLLTIIYYVFGFVEVQYLNTVDQGFLHFLRRTFKPRWSTRLALTLRRAVLMYSDQQLVTGIALLVTGFSQLSSGLDAYHWQILVYLVWFSSLTHLTTLTVLRQYFQDNPAIRWWRMVFMLFIVLTLSVALVPTGNSIWPINSPETDLIPFHETMDSNWTSAGIPVRCYFSPNAPSYRYSLSASSMIVSLSVLFYGYLTRLVKLSSRAATFSRHWLRIAPRTLWKQWMIRCREYDGTGAKKLLSKLLFVIMETVYVCLHGWYEIYDSMLWEIMWLFFALAWGSKNIFLTWNLSGLNEVLGGGTYSISEENYWGFGQIFPVILLSLPLFSIWESFAGTYQNTPKMQIRNNNEHRDDVDSRIEAFSHFLDNDRPLFRIGQWQSQMAANNSIHPLPRYQQYEWFHLLITMMVLFLCGNASWLIALGENPIHGVGGLTTYLACCVICTIVYAAVFVIISHSHVRTDDFIEHHIKVPRYLQHRCFRIFGYILAFGISGILISFPLLMLAFREY